MAKKVWLTASKFKALSQISTDIAQIFFASVVISPLLAGNTLERWYIITIGVFFSLGLWWLSLSFAEKGKL